MSVTDPTAFAPSPARIAPRPGAIRLFGLDLLDAAPGRALSRLLDRGRVTAAFVNAHCVNVAMHDPAYRAALTGADLLLPDGAGIAIAARLQGERFTANLNGTDLFLPLCEAAAVRDLSVYFLGSAPGVAEGAARAARRRVPALRVAGHRHGYFESDGPVLSDIAASGADIVLVAMGVPRQELWIARHRSAIQARLVVGVGAQFDFWSGRMPRAPEPLRRAGLEWVYRLGLEPRRMAGRYVAGNPAFLARAVRARLRAA
ncbi:MAG: WecB/TagA/CpsF family glycosyltransferase [Pseudomonadota bacterium]